MIAEILKVLVVEREERQLAEQAASGDPGVVGRSRATTELSMGLKVTPRGSDANAVGKDDDVRKERLQLSEAAGAPTSNQGPLGQLANSYKRNSKRGASEVSCNRVIHPTAKDVGCRVGVEDDKAHEPSERREAYRSARNSWNSCSDSQASGYAKAAKEVTGPTP